MEKAASWGDFQKIWHLGHPTEIPQGFLCSDPALYKPLRSECLVFVLLYQQLINIGSNTLKCS